MNNEAMVISSPEKIHSHELINKVLFKWIKFHMLSNKFAQVITMPASSVRQENQIIEYIKDVRSDIMGPVSIVELKTFDNRFEAHETGITCDECHYGRQLWRHYKCTDIFKKILKLTASVEEDDEIVKAPTAAWFDMCGGLTDDNYYGMQEVLSRVFADGSLLFTTLAIDNIRGMSKNSLISRAYASWSSGVLRRRIATDIVLGEMADEAGRYLRPVFDPYVYRRNGARTTYAVFGYVVGKK